LVLKLLNADEMVIVDHQKPSPEIKAADMVLNTAT
jgi:hypothetical protein